MLGLDDLSLEEKAAQLVFARLGSNMPPPVTVAEDLERFSRLLEDVPLGGVIVFNGSYPETPRALAALQRNSRVPLLVTADMERGVGQQIRGATVFPHAMTFSKAGGDLLARAARAQAREALACGIHVTFSPVADVNRDPRNPIIATRAFATDPKVSADLVRAFIRACKSEGVLTTAKHFPGHGNTSRDSHEELPVVDSSRQDLMDNDLLPFAAAIEEGVDLVMSAHILCPALDPDNPATLSEPILRGLLREEMGFTGAVITDSLLMGAISASHANAGLQAAALVRSGVDILLDVRDPAAAVKGIVEAVKEGSLDEALVDEASARVLALKQGLLDRFGEKAFTGLDGNHVGSDKNRKLADEIARKAITLMDDTAGRIPLPARGDLLAVLIKPHRTRLDPPEEPFGEAIRRAFPGATYRQLGPDAAEAELREVRELASKAGYIVLALVVKPAAWHAFGLLPAQEDLVRELVDTYRALVVSLGSPFILERFDGAGSRLCTFSDVAASQLAAVDLLAGR